MLRASIVFIAQCMALDSTIRFTPTCIGILAIRTTTEQAFTQIGAMDGVTTHGVVVMECGVEIRGEWVLASAHGVGVVDGGIAHIAMAVDLADGVTTITTTVIAKATGMVIMTA
jgi:hypothetical protein